MKRRNIILTGGGTAGHVTPNLALIPELRKSGYIIHYIGRHQGIEKDLIQKAGIPYYGISSGKLRRYFSFRNFTDLIKIIFGFIKAVFLVYRLKPDIVFSKGGFVSCPVVWAAWLYWVPVIIHESDLTPGLANKLCIPFAKKVCHSFPETTKFLPENKRVHTGLPIRKELLIGDKETGEKLCGFRNQKPILLVIGGSMGAQVINTSVRAALGTLLQKFNICHICGTGHIDDNLNHQAGYKQFDYVSEELSHLMTMADLVISRAGATVLFELLALKKPSLLIPLTLKASRGDQIDNAKSFEKQGFSMVLAEEELNPNALINTVNTAYENLEKMSHAISLNKTGNGLENVFYSINQYSADYKI